MHPRTHNSAARPPSETRKWLNRLDAPDGFAFEPFSDLPTRATTEELIGSSAVRWAVVTARRAADYIADLLPLFGSEPGALQLLRRAVESTTLAVLRALQTGDVDALWPGVEPADSTQSYVRRQIPLDQVMRGIHLCQEVLTSALHNEIGALAEPADVVRESRETTLLLFRCFDHFSANIATHYSLEAEKWSQSAAAARAELIDRVLSSPDFIDVAGTSAALAYQLDEKSVALAVWLDDPYPGTGSSPALERIVDRVLFATGRPAHLIRWAGPATMYLWLQANHAVVIEQLAALDHAALGQARVAVGHAAPSGVHGFGAGHASARRAEKVARLARDRLPRIITFESVEIASLMVDDITAVRHFVQGRLADLAAADERTSELRDTLCTYVNAGRSLNQTAKQLHTHRNTIAYRIKKAEGLLPDGANLNSAELGLALHLAGLFGGDLLHTNSGNP